MTSQLSSYLSSRCESRVRPGGQRGVFARVALAKGELIAIFGGAVYPWEGLMALPEGLRSLSLQVEDELFLVPEQLGEGDYVNHSCNPNAGLSGQICLVAMREIAPGEEVRFDYAMCDSLPYDEFDCECEEANCRGRITGGDWKIKELQERYAGYFSPYLQMRIDALKAGRPHKYQLRGASNYARLGPQQRTQDGS
jgi:hypothetical protein